MNNNSEQWMVASPGRRGLAALVEAMRPGHWIKNAFVLAPILFARRYADAAAWGRIAIAFAVFCLLSSGAYLVNDAWDRVRDRSHPAKRHRPVASGRLSPLAAWSAGVLLAVGGLAIAAAEGLIYAGPDLPLRGLGLPIWAGAYVLLSFAYTFWLKNHDVVDVLVVAFGFVLRAMAGAAAIAVAPSPWLVLCTFTLCLYIALAKRRSELVDLPAEQALAARPASGLYDVRDVEHMLTVSTAMAILAYSLYCLAPSTIAHAGSAHMVWTIPLVIYGLFRYNRITRTAGRDDPVAVLLRDKAMWLVMAAYLAMSVLVLQFGGRPSVRNVIELPK